MRKINYTAMKGLACSVSAVALVISASAAAQDPGAEEEPDGISTNDTDDEQVVLDENADGTPEEDAGAIVVTGSRIKRDTYSSISPLQVLSTEASQEAGLFDPSQILQRSESASGTQIDATFQGFVLDNGPGSQTLNLRGLGADRTLLLINGRRLAPAGVEGAPTNPSINLLPGSLIERYDLLLDGASSVYGSDAVAGVGNVILRKDFDGLELFARGEINPDGAGEDYTVSAAYGINTDRGFLGIGVEYDYRDLVRLSDRDFFRGCTTNLDITEDGEIRTLGIDQQVNALADSNGTITTSASECVQDGFNGRIFTPFTDLGSIYFQNGNSNTGIPNFNESFFNGSPVDADGDGVRDVDFLNEQNTNAANQEQVFLSEQELFNVMAYGEYTFPGAANITPYFEALYSRAEIFADNTFVGQVFPFVPDDNQFNPCNPAAEGGVDCRAAQDATFGTGLGAFGAQAVLPIFAIQGDRNNTDVVQEQYRGVLGVKGDLPFISPSWSFDTSFIYSRAEGTSVTNGIREDKLAFALGIDPTQDFDSPLDGIVDNNGDGIADDYDQNVRFGRGLIAGIVGDRPSIDPCDADALANPDLAAPDLLQGCVPVNLFAPSVLGQTIGDFATQAERDYVFGQRSFDTTYEQIIFNAFATGDLFELPAGPVGAVVGVEYRRDEINSVPNFVASNGLFFAFFADSGAVGSRELKEAFAEIDVPLQSGKPWVRELTANFSGRVTDEEFYGTNFTYSAKLGWRPIDPLLIKMSYGTSFRAPNLRENFLASQTGFQTLFDPCAVPDLAFDDVTNSYDASNDFRDPQTLLNCEREGRDPERVGLGVDPITGALSAPIQNPSVEIASGGSLDLDPETSRSITAGFAFEETFGDGFDVSLGFNYFDIKLEDSIVQPSSQFILNDCYTREDGQRSTFCDRITTTDGGRALVSDVFAGFINLNEENVRGIDLNATFGKDVTAFGKIIDLGLNFRANHLIERSNLFIGDDGNQTFDEDAGEFGLPEWTGRATFTADVDDLRFTWQVRYVDSVAQDPDDVEGFGDAFNNAANLDPDNREFGATCLGAGSGDYVDGVFVPDGIVPGDGVFCRPVGFADEVFYHTASLRYRFDGFTIIAGVDNIFNTAPPQVSPDAAGITDISNTAIGAGYDYDGREFFFSVRKEF